MKVDYLELKGILRHKDTTLEFPDKGVVLVTGPNGAGKSSFVEAVSMAAWGKTLRGSSGWDKATKKAEVRLIAHNFEVTRRNYGADKLSIDLVEGCGVLPVYEKKSFTQATIETVFGSHEVWRRTSVFSSSDAANFTSATDKERKVLLEALLGLHIFDRAQQVASADFSLAQKDVAEAEQQASCVDLELRYAAKALEEAQQTRSATEVELRDDGREPFIILQEIQDLEDEWEAKLANLRRLEDAATRAAVEFEHFRSMGQFNDCPTCGQALPNQAAPQEEKKEEARKKMEATHKKAASYKAILQSDTTVERMKVLQHEAQESRNNRQHNQTISRMIASQQESIEKNATLVAELGEKQKQAQAWLTACKHTLDVYTAVQKVMGTKGLRAQVLGRAIAGIEARANHYLSKLAGPDFRLKLSASKENKTGGTRDELSLEITGVGGGDGYKGASAGERRRVDVALLFALADVAAAAHGSTPGTLFVDEAFDALDAAGTEAVVELLSEISRDRCVFVITHSEDLAKRLSPVRVVRVEDGQVQ